MGGHTDGVFRLIYRSQVSRQVRLADAHDIAQHAARNNHRVGVTGVLVYTPSHFIQVLEGPELSVHALLSRIRGDERHSHVTIIEEQHNVQPLFGDWAMRVALPSSERSPKVIEALDGPGVLHLIEQCMSTDRQPASS